jgi:SAM-dependent methyltransferase
MAEPDPPDIAALVEQLRARVAERRADGTYSDELEEDLSVDFERVLARRGRRRPDLAPLVTAVGAAMNFDPARIPVESTRSGGDRVHRAVARLVHRQIQGVFDQVGAFAIEVHRALGEIAETLANQTAELTGRVDALCERQAAQERALVQSPAGPAGGPRPAYFSAGLEEQLAGSRADVLARYRDVAAKLVEAGPVADVACGRGELLELLAEQGIPASGADPDEELAAVAAGLGLPAEAARPGDFLARFDDASLGAVVLLRAAERLTGETMASLAALAAAKVRPGGAAVVETLDPDVAAAVAAASRDPAHVRLYHPDCLVFLLREAGFSEVGVEPGSTPERRRVVARR